MKKIILFILFPILLFIYIYLAYFQTKRSAIINQEKIQTTNTPTSTSQEITPVIITKNIDEINLIIKFPQSGVNVESTSITIEGSTEANATVMINDSEVQAAKDGGFKSNILLDEGDNYISIVAYNESGSVSEREIIVTRNITGL